MVTCAIVGPDFVYTVENAVTAYIERYTDPGNVLVDTTDVALDAEGDASGSHATASGYSYCIVAINDCGQNVCCSYCRAVSCFYEIEFPGPGNTLADDQIKFTGYGLDGPLTLTMDGDVEVVASGVASIEKIYTLGSSMPDEICVHVEADCGTVSECCFPVPCCWRSDDLVIEVQNLNVTDHICSYDRISGGCYNPSTALKEWYVESSEISVTGLSGLSGTHMYSLRGSPALQVIPLTEIPETDPVYYPPNYVYDGWCACWDTGYVLNSGVSGTVTVNTQRSVAPGPWCGSTPTGCSDNRDLTGMLYHDIQLVFNGDFYWECLEPIEGEPYKRLRLYMLVTSSTNYEYRIPKNFDRWSPCSPIITNSTDDWVGWKIPIAIQLGDIYGQCDVSLPVCDPNCFIYSPILIDGATKIGHSPLVFPIYRFFEPGTLEYYECQSMYYPPVTGDTFSHPFFTMGSLESRYYFT